VSPRNTFYTDDRQNLVEAACHLGIKGFVFKGIQQLYRDLTSAGINIKFTLPSANVVKENTP
ncbi:MAG: hypothetical protein ACM3IL_05605, partial [Deltaproteobacteria bacterium]